MLIAGPRMRRGDREAWEVNEQLDRAFALANRRQLEEDAARSASAIAIFARESCYAGVSWGKDSVVVAHLIATTGISVPLVWVRVSGRENPLCTIVRDAFLSAFPGVDYHEIAVEADDGRPGRLTSGLGFDEASRRWGDRRISGVRGAESHARELRMRRWGISTARTCAPIGRWSTAAVFAYLHLHALPVHPAYAYTFGGSLPRDRIRVSSIGGERGTGHGRAEWERAYYGTPKAR